MDSDMSDDPAIRNLSLSDPRRVNKSCQAFLDAENDSQDAISWASQFEYGHWTTYYYSRIIGVLVLWRIAQFWRDRRTPSQSHKSASSVHDNVLSIFRFISYRHVTIKPLNKLGLPSLRMLTFVLVTIVFLLALTFVQKPYYRGHLEYGSPPIAIRTGLMSFACVPILIALLGKSNFVTLLTGINHEKLNVLHRWVAWMSFVLALVHTIPLFLQSYWDAPLYQVSGVQNVYNQFYANGFLEGDSEYTGVPPFAILFAICLFLLPFVSRRFYETFYYTHILLGITYVGLLFWHSGGDPGGAIDSCAYLWAAAAL